MIGAQNFATVAALRFLLGLLESTFYAGVTLVVAGWCVDPYVRTAARLTSAGTASTNRPRGSCVTACQCRQSAEDQQGLWTLLNGALPIPFYAICTSVSSPSEAAS
jgi:hypothetical protein